MRSLLTVPTDRRVQDIPYPLRLVLPPRNVSLRNGPHEGAIHHFFPWYFFLWVVHRSISVWHRNLSLVSAFSLRIDTVSDRVSEGGGRSFSGTGVEMGELLDVVEVGIEIIFGFGWVSDSFARVKVRTIGDVVMHSGGHGGVHGVGGFVDSVDLQFFLFVGAIVHYWQIVQVQLQLYRLLLSLRDVVVILWKMHHSGWSAWWTQISGSVRGGSPVYF